MKKAMVDGRVNQAIVTPRLKKQKNEEQEDTRTISARQLMVLYYHFYLMLNDTSICGFNDCDKTAAQFQSEMDKEVRISKEMLEKLLYTTQIAFENNLYWNPADEDINAFIKGCIEKKEYFNKLTCLISTKKDVTHE